MVEEASDTPNLAGDETIAPVLGIPPESVERRYLLVLNGPSSSMFQLPAEGRVVIGRSETADLQVDDPSISRHHAELSVTRDRIELSDLGSQNGTFVNRERLTGPRAVLPGDTIAIHQATLILQTTTPAPAHSVVLATEAFRQHLDDEIERAVRYEHSFTVLVLRWPEPVADRRAVERVLDVQLRRIDAATWVAEDTLHVLLAGAESGEAAAVMARIRTQVAHPSLRIGHATCPTDGADAEALLVRAAAAATGARAGETLRAGRMHQTMTIGSQRVIIADPAVVRLYALIDRLAPADLPVLIMGETGCGKELAASAIHLRSPRAVRTLVSLNCAAIQESLVESELFGHERGAFSGAVAAKSGVLEAAHGSTLFLDELGELALTTQAKLLRVLETGRFTRLGDVKERKTDVRIVAATNRDLVADVETGRFRQDLYFRLSGATLYLPPLRERPRELPLLATAFLDAACARLGRGPMRISDAAMRALHAYSWPGNVRELKNLMAYAAAAFTDPELAAEQVQERLAPKSRTQAASIAVVGDGVASFRPLADEIRELEITRIRAALDATGGNQTRAAALLSMPIRTLFDKVKQYGLTTKRKRGNSEV